MASILTDFLRISYFVFFQAEDGIRYIGVTGVQTCALPILPAPLGPIRPVMPPRWTSRWSTDTAVRPPKVRVTPSTTMAGSGLATPTSQGRSRSAARASRRGAPPVAAGSRDAACAPCEAGWPGVWSAGIEHHLSSVTEDALWSEDQQQHEPEPDEHEPELSHVGRREQVLGDHTVADERTQSGVGELDRSEEHTSELQSRQYLVCRLLL